MTAASVGPIFSLSALWRDFTFAARMFTKSPLFTTIVVLTLVIGIGLNTAVVSAVQAIERLRASPMVEDVGMISDMPLGVSSSDRGVSIPGYAPQKDESMSILYASAAPAYFKTMGITMRGGREFTEQDDSASVPVIIVNERFAQRF